MKRLLLFLILTLSFQTWTKADDIRDFEIEGMSIGDSLLNFMSVEEIKDADRNYVENKKYYITGKDKDLKNYDMVDVYLKSGDNNYIIKALGGTIFMELKKCLPFKDKILKEVSGDFLNTSKETFEPFSHIYDKSGKSIQHQTLFRLNDGNIRIECVDWSKKIESENNWQDNINVSAVSKEISLWITSGYK
jgi:hypothetical protein